MIVRVGYNNPTGQPLPTQARFHQSKAKYRLLAGGFGTGKTRAIVLEMLKDIAIPKNYGMLGRLDLIELRSTTLSDFFELMPEQAIVSHNGAERIINFQNGSTLFYTNLDSSKGAEDRISSLNLGFAVVDQLEETAESIFLAIQGRLRRTDSRRCFYASCNPAGHDWIYYRWKENEMLKASGLTYNPNYALFEAVTTENIYLPQDYIQELMQYPEAWKKRYVFCSWDNFEGLVYNEFNEATCMIDHFEPEPNKLYYHFHILDYGFTNPTAILYAMYDPETKIVYLYDEFYKSGMIIPDIANAYKQNPYWRDAIRLADPSIYHTDKDGKSIYTDFLREGIFWARASNDKIRGYNRVNTMFKQGRLRITKNMLNFRREIGNYRWKEVKPFEDKNAPEEARKSNDHLMDCLRYLCNAIEDGYMNKVAVQPIRARGVQIATKHKVF